MVLINVGERQFNIWGTHKDEEENDSRGYHGNKAGLSVKGEADRLAAGESDKYALISSNKAGGG